MCTFSVFFYQLDYDNDNEWSQWNIAGKMRILMEANAAPPTVHYSNEGGVNGLVGNPLRSLPTSNISFFDNYASSMEYPSTGSHAAARHSTVSATAMSYSNTCHPSSIEYPSMQGDAAVRHSSLATSNLSYSVHPQSMDVDKTARHYASSLIASPSESDVSSVKSLSFETTWDYNEIDKINKENNSGFELGNWDGGECDDPINTRCVVAKEKVGQNYNCVIVG